MIRPPDIPVSYEDLPEDPGQRHEALVDLFGQYLFWIRQETFDRTEQLVRSADARNQLGRLFRQAYEEAAELGDEEKRIALGLVRSSVDFFARMFLTMISGQGFDDKLGPNHVMRFRLDMEICDAETGEPVSEETINRNGEKFFPEYWGRWLNRYSAK